MGVVVRQSLKSSLVSYSGVILGIINLTFLSPKILTAEQIGLRDLLINTSLAFAFFAHLGMSQVITRFFPTLKDEKHQNNGILIVSLGITAFGFLLFSGLFWSLQAPIKALFEEKSPLINQYFWHFIPLVAFISFQTLIEAFSRVNFRIVVPSIIRDIGIRIIYTILIILYAQHIINFEYLIRLLIVSYGLSVLANLLYLKHLNQLFFNPKCIKIYWFQLKPMLHYGFWVMLAGAGTIISDRLDGLMLASFISLSTSGIYSISYFIGTIIEMPKRAIGTIILPILADAANKNDTQQIESLYKKSALNQLLIGGWLFSIIWSAIDGIFRFIPNGEVFSQGKSVVLFIGLANLIDMATGVNSEIIINSKYYRFNMILVIILGLLSFSLNYFLIPLYGLQGAAVATFLSMLCFNILKMWFVWYRFKLLPFTHKTIKAVLVMALFFVICMLMPLPSFENRWFTLMSLIIYSGVLSIIATLLVTKSRISDDINLQLDILDEKWPILKPLVKLLKP